MAFFIMHTLLPSLFRNQVRFSLTGIQARTCSPTSNASLRKAVGSPREIQNPLCLRFIFCFLSFLFLFPTSNLFSLRKFTISLPPDPTTQLRIFMFQHQQSGEFGLNSTHFLQSTHLLYLFEYILLL